MGRVLQTKGVIIMDQLIYRGSDPEPKHEHGEQLGKHGVIRSRRRVYGGWEYGCWSEEYQATFFVTEFDERKP